MNCEFERWLIWAPKDQIPAQKVGLDQVWIQKWESKLVQKWGPNQKIDVHTLTPSMKCDWKILVILFYDVLIQDSMLTPEYEKNLVKIPELLLNQKIKWNCQLVGLDHIMLKFNFRDGITCQNVNVTFKTWSLIKFKWMSWNWILVSTIIWFFGPIDRVRDIRIGQRLTRKTFITPIDQFAHYWV